MAKTIEGKSRLVYRTYQVLDKVDVVVAGKSDSELMAVLLSTYHRRAAEVAMAEPSQPKPRGRPKLPEALTYPHAKVAA
jgi:hypothetical protein